LAQPSSARSTPLTTVPPYSRLPDLERVEETARAALVTLGIPVRAVDGELRELLCDPLTGLVAYPSFAECLIGSLPTLSTSTGLHLAIGDVDDLKEYVSQRRAEDPTMFGHLAGNQCMEAVGRATTAWSHEALRTSTFALCGTFGGDEVIVATAGVAYDRFVASIRDLAQAIDRAAPRTCSFAVGTFPPGAIFDHQATAAYRQFVAAIDAALFFHKAELREQHLKPRGELKDIGDVRVVLSGPDDHEEEAACRRGS
jgi:GGDEF domain-containing protein